MNFKRSFLQLLQIVFFTGTYYFTASLGLELDAVSGFATLFWLPTGISLAGVLLFGYRMFPGILLGALLANYFNGAPFLVAGLIAIGNTLEALFGAYLLQRFVGFHPSLERLKDVIGLILLAACLSTLLSATIGTTSLFLGGLLTTSYSSTWTAWWVGDMISNLLIGSFLLVWSKNPQVTFQLLRVVEWIFLAFLVCLIGVFIFTGFLGSQSPNITLTYIVFPPLIWLALRFGPREVVTATFFLSLSAVWGIIHRQGPFFGESIGESLFFLQSFMVVVSVTSLILAAVVSERRAMEKRKADFVSFASHELKTPLTSIKLFTRMLKKEIRAGDTKAATYLTRLDLQVDKLIHLVNDMLDLPKVQKGTLELRKERFSLTELVQEIVEEMQESSVQHSVILRGTGVQDIYADKERIGQVLINLLSNAIKYSPSGAKIIITTNVAKGRVLVSVKDFGLGIPKAQRERIFDRFYRVTNDNMHKTPGLGIGLYLSDMIIKQHGGTISVQSREKKGSTFSFTLPI